MPLSSAHDALLSFRAPALGSTQVWRIVCVVAGFELAFSLTPALLGPFVDWTWPDAALEVLQYAGFGVTLLAVWLLVWLLHGRGPGSLMGPRPAVLRDGGRVLVAVGLVLAVQLPFDLGGIAGDLRLAPVGGWLFWLAPALLAITLQVATEEIYFRGYLTQQLAAIGLQRRIWLLLPSVYFGTSHLLNGDGLAEGALWAIWATLLGAACADLTARTGNLGAAIGLHLGNNLFAALVLGYIGMPGFGLALFLLPAADYIPMTAGLGDLFSAWSVLDIAYSILGVGVMWLAARVAIRA